MVPLAGYSLAARSLICQNRVLQNQEDRSEDTLPAGPLLVLGETNIFEIKERVNRQAAFLSPWGKCPQTELRANCKWGWPSLLTKDLALFT
jgi:hypothetical protein